MPKSKREKPNVSPKDLAERLEPLGTLRAKALLRQAFGELEGASGVLERLAEALRLLDETAPEGTEDGAIPDGTKGPKGKRTGRPARR